MSLFIDAKGAVKAWVDTHPTLTGDGKPIRLGAHLRSLGVPNKGTYIRLTQVGGDRSLGFASRSRISASVFGMTEQVVDDAAAAYANALLELERGNTTVTGGICLMVANITGPLDIPASANPQRLVDADFYLVSA